MKKILVVCVALTIGLVFSNSTKAQQLKIGVFDEESVLGLFPDIQKVQTALDQYAQDSLKGEYDYTLSEFKRLDSTFKKDSATLAPSVKSLMQKDIATNYSKIVNWQQYQQQMLQAKQNQLLEPYLKKVYAAFQEVVAEQKYTWVLKKDACVIPGGLADNISIKVAQKLKLPLPQEVMDELKRQGLPTGSTETGTKPTTKPAVKH
ncbi:outer membrane protein (OmpH-like) [mine drainage metagenome]|uniref:Outer membrane protein (OmpH-like) n=1 Tax=mine drainage metagenome TaxID=410659 RepID=A0A1J5SAN1_9ZZZZ